MPPRGSVRDGLTWHLLLEPAGRPGAENMALDEALLLDAHRSGRAYLRLYRWAPPCLSFGRNEPARARYDRAAIERLGLDVVRRPTGGRAVWHEHEVTYAVAAPLEVWGSVRASYRAIHARLAQALRALGAAVELAPTVRGPRPADGPCFAAPAGGELVVAGRKLVGSAQVRHGGALLQHGSILLDGSQAIVRNVSRDPGAVRGETSLRTLGCPTTFDEVTGVIVRSWGAGFVEARDPAVHASRYADPEWTWRR